MGKNSAKNQKKRNLNLINKKEHIIIPCSTKKSFLKWLDECCEELMLVKKELMLNWVQIGFKISLTDEKINGIRFEYALEVDEMLNNHGLYTSKNIKGIDYYGLSYLNGTYHPPTKHYLIWLKETFPQEF